MRVLAIDPGYGRCGMAVVEKNNGREHLVFSTCVETSPSAEFSDRLREISTECERLINVYKPDCIAMEKLYLQRNQKTAMRVAEARGALINTAARCGMKVTEYTPGQIKSAAAGWGGADKRAVAQMMHVLMKIEKTIKYDDEYDAIAIGVTHLAIGRTT